MSDREDNNDAENDFEGHDSENNEDDVVSVFEPIQEGFLFLLAYESPFLI